MHLFNYFVTNYCFQGVATALFSYILLGEKLTFVQCFGGVLVFSSTLASSYISAQDSGNEATNNEISPALSELELFVGEETNLLTGSKGLNIQKYAETSHSS